MSILNKPVSDISGATEDQKNYNASEDSGVLGHQKSEGVPSYVETATEKVYHNGHNAWLVLGRDRYGDPSTGHGGAGHSHCGSIDLVVGRMARDAASIDIPTGEGIWANPDFTIDSARIYISQKSNIDKYFRIPEGKVGSPAPRSAVAVKADSVRVIARHGIKLVTGTDEMNSQGGAVASVSGIDLIAGNNDDDMQPLVKGRDLIASLNAMVDLIDNLTGIVDSFSVTQAQLNFALTSHFHHSPFFAIPTTPSTTVVPAGMKAAAEMLIKVKMSLVSMKLNLGAYKIDYLSDEGSGYICSSYNHTN